MEDCVRLNPLALLGARKLAFCGAALQQPRRFNVTIGSANKKLKATA
jgi:hypothetical protein